jgi:hypothetical protein
MYLGLLTPTLYIRSYPVQDWGYTNFRELWIGEVPRILLPRTSVNKGTKKGRSLSSPDPPLAFGRELG